MALWVSAITIQAMLEAFRALGLDDQRLLADASMPEHELESRARAGQTRSQSRVATQADEASLAGVPGMDGGHVALLPELVRQRLLAGACRAAKREEFAVEAGLALPFGAFGLMDYLATSADTLGKSCEAMARHFHNVSCEHSLETETCESEFRVKLFSVDMGVDTAARDDFAVGALLSRLRGRVEGFSLASVRLRRGAPQSAARFVALLGAPVTFGHAVTTLCLPARMREAPLSSADPWLRRTLQSLLPPDERAGHRSALERSLRGCLRELLPERKFAAARVASALGMSERSLHRRLRELGQSYQGMVDVFRREEAERLLLDGRVDMAEIAHRLGFGDQSAFSRAFRRWTRMAPSAWLAFASR
jgi:AraC-like DNA-binding protein